MTPAVPPARTSNDPITDLSVKLTLPAAAPAHLLPNLLIAGVTHAGATDLSRALARHKQIKLPVTKRIDHYEPMRYDLPVEAPLADYDRHFANWTGQRYRLECSPIYFDAGRHLVGAVARDLPGLRVVILLKDPVERLWTSYRDKIERGRLPKAMSYQAFVERCLALRANASDRFEGNRYFRTLSCGLYADHVGAWLDAFGRRTRVVFAEDLLMDRRRNLAALYDWLGLDPNTVPLEADPDGEESSALQSFTDAPRRGRVSLPRPADALRRPAEAGIDLVRRCTRPRVPRQSDRLRMQLERLYAPANRRLAEQLRDLGYRDLPGWLEPA